MDKATVQRALEILQSGRDLHCPKLIEKFVWANSVEPKFKLGDPVVFENSETSLTQVVDREHIDALAIPDKVKKNAKAMGRVRLCARVNRAIGKVVRIKRDLNERTFFYEIEYEVDYESEAEHGKPITKHTAFSYERNLEATPAYEVNRWSQLGTIYIG